MCVYAYMYTCFNKYVERENIEFSMRYRQCHVCWHVYSVVASIFASIIHILTHITPSYEGSLVVPLADLSLEVLKASFVFADKASSFPGLHASGLSHAQAPAGP